MKMGKVLVTKFQFAILIRNAIYGIVYFCDFMLESLWNVSETHPWYQAILDGDGMSLYQWAFFVLFCSYDISVVREGETDDGLELWDYEIIENIPHVGPHEYSATTVADQDALRVRISFQSLYGLLHGECAIV